MNQSIVVGWEQVCGIIGGLFAIFGIFYKLIDKKFEKVDKMFDKQDAYMREAKRDTDSKLEKQDVSLTEYKKENNAKFDKLIQTIASFDKHVEHRLTKMEMEAKNTNQRLLTIEHFFIPKKVYQFETEEILHPEKQTKEN